MAFKTITGKLGNMRKTVEWLIYPIKKDDDFLIIQSDKRIAKILINEGIAVLSSGKNGHNGFMHLSPALGSMQVPVPSEMLGELKQLFEKDPKNGEVRVL